MPPATPPTTRPPVRRCIRGYGAEPSTAPRRPAPRASKAGMDGYMLRYWHAPPTPTIGEPPHSPAQGRARWFTGITLDAVGPLAAVEPARLCGIRVVGVPARQWRTQSPPSRSTTRIRLHHHGDDA